MTQISLGLFCMVQACTLGQAGYVHIRDNKDVRYSQLFTTIKTGCRMNFAIFCRTYCEVYL